MACQPSVSWLPWFEYKNIKLQMVFKHTILTFIAVQQSENRFRSGWYNKQQVFVSPHVFQHINETIVISWFYFHHWQY